MADAFSLKKMYDDVHEPLVSLGEVRRETTENEQKNSVGDIITLHHSLRATDEYSCGARAKRNTYL